MKVLITGGAGFIGSHLADRLLDEDHEVLVIDNYATGRRDNLTERDGLDDRGGHDRGRRTSSSRRSSDFRPDFVVHAAAAYKDPEAWGADVLTNALGTVNVVKAAQATGVERLLYFQTALCYGTTPTEQPVTLDHPIRPDSSYGISKTAGELYIELSGHRLRVVPARQRLRPAQHLRPAADLLPPADRGQGRVRDGHAARLHLRRRPRRRRHAGDRRRQGPRALPHLLRHGLRDQGAVRRHDRGAARGRARRATSRCAPRGEDDAYTILLDPSRVRQDFGWEPKVPLEEGVRRAIEYYREYGISQTYTHLKVAE